MLAWCLERIEVFEVSPRTRLEMVVGTVWMLRIKLESSERTKHQLGKCFHKNCLEASLWGCFLINDQCGRVQPTVGSAIP